MRDGNSHWLEAESHGLLESACGTGAVAEWREAELASELLELSSEPELDRFFRELIRSAVPETPAAASALSAILGRAATQVLPLAGKPLGDGVAPGAGARTADRAGAPLGLELEGLSAQDGEFELARQFVRFASVAAREMAGSDAGSPPGASAWAAAARAAGSHAPGLLSALAGDEPGAIQPGRRRSTPLRTAQSVRHVPELRRIPERGGTAMYGTEMRQGEFRRQRRGRRWRDTEAEGEFPFSPMRQSGGYGRHHWRRHRWADSEGEGHPGGYGAGEQQFLPLLPLIGSVLGGLFKEAEAEASGEYGEAGYGPGEYGEAGYGPGEYGEAEYGEAGYGPGEYGEAEYGEAGYGPGEYGEAEYGEAGYGPGEYGEAEYGEAGYGPGEYGEAEYGEAGYGPGEYGEAEYGEAEYGEAEQFLGGIVRNILGGEAEQPGSALSPAHEAQLASQLLEISDEAELENFLGHIVNLAGRAFGGIKDLARSPLGQAVVKAVAPLAKSVLPMAGAAIGSTIAPGIGTSVGRALGTAASSIFEVGEAGEQAEYELARRVVQLTSAAAKSAVLAPPGAPPEAVGELAVFHETRHFAPGFHRRAVHRFRPYARRFGGTGFGRRVRYHGGRYGRPLGRYYGGWPGRPLGRYYGGYTPPADSEPAPDAGPPPEGPPPAAPGFRWVAVPIDAPVPGPAAPVPAGPPGPGGPGSPGGPPPDQGEMPGWGRRPSSRRGYGA